jgi:3-hydroxymyristoyl/3-hydroxydecanoyl-(acyl carrier protein) dehydratase
MSAGNTEREVHSAIMRVSQHHPALPGHFPGRPIVPGVVLLDRVLQEAQHWLGQPLTVTQLPQVKFTRPLLPEQDAWMHLRLRDHELRFWLTRVEAASTAAAQELIAQGMFQIAAPTARVGGR